MQQEVIIPAKYASFLPNTASVNININVGNNPRQGLLKFIFSLRDNMFIFNYKDQSIPIILLKYFPIISNSIFTIVPTSNSWKLVC